MTGLICKDCVHRYEGPRGAECRRNPPQVVTCEWKGEGSVEHATSEQLADQRNWIVVSAFPHALAHCGDFVQQVYGL